MASRLWVAFLHSEQSDEEVRKKEAQKELRYLLQMNFDIELSEKEALSNWRLRLGRHVLLTELCLSLKDQVPSSLSSIPTERSMVGKDSLPTPRRDMAQQAGPA